MTTLTNALELSPTMIEAILTDHTISHKRTKDGRVLALDCSSLKGRLIEVWIFAPTTSHKLFEWLGY